MVVVYTQAGEVLLLERVQPPGYWQSVTGSLEWGENADEAAQRELFEETGLQASDKLYATGQVNCFHIVPAWKARYAPDVNENTEYVYQLSLAQREDITLHQQEHVNYRWLPAAVAAEQVASTTNRDAILHLPIRI